MTSSIAPSSRARSLAVTLATCVIAWVLLSAGLEGFARFVENRLDAHLWRYEEWMQILSPARYKNDVPGRILVLGPSEAREAFWPEPFQGVFDDARLVNDSLSLSTFEDAITQLEYIEAVYGRGAIGDVLIVALSPRLVLGYAPGERPLEIVLNRYSPYFALDESVKPQALIKKGPLDSLIARVRLAGHSGARYQKAFRALFLATRAHFRGEDRKALFRAYQLVGSRFYTDPPHDKSQYYEWVRTGSGILPSMNYYFKLRDMDAFDRREAIVRDFGRLREIASRNGARIIVVNMPEGGWARNGFYQPGIHEHYMTVVREAIGDLPFVDLREALPDDGFFDFVHPTMDAGFDLSRRVVAEIRKTDIRKTQSR